MLMKAVVITRAGGPEVTQVPSFVESVLLNNQTSVQQSETAVFGTKATNSSTFNQTTGGSETIQASAGLKIPFLASGSIQSTTTVSNSQMDGKTSSQEDDRTYNFPVIVPANSTVTATVTVTMYNMNVPYTATLKGINTGKIITINGIWQGVQADQITETFKMISSQTKATSTKTIILDKSLVKTPVTF